MELKHGFTTRAEWENFFKIYFTQIRELEEFNSFQMDKEPQQWIRDFAEKSHKLERKYRKATPICCVTFTISPENTIPGKIRWRIRCSPSSTVTVPVLRTLKPPMNWREPFAFYDSRNDPVALMKCDMIVLTVCFFWIPSTSKAGFQSYVRMPSEFSSSFIDQLNEEEKSMGMSFYDYQAVFSSEYLNEAPFPSAGQLFEEYENRLKMLRRFQGRG